MGFAWIQSPELMGARVSETESLRELHTIIANL